MFALRFDNSFARLPEYFYQRVRPQPLHNTHLAGFSPEAAALLDLPPESLRRPEFVKYFAGAELLPGMEPLAALYAGHQFGHYVPQLGDGRAILLGEVINARGERWDVQLKGAGLTAFSRQGDGRAVLRSTIREFLASEAMAGLGIPTTRALAFFASDTPVYREQVERGAMLVRLAPSHVRFGSFEVFYYRRQYDALRILADYVIDIAYPGLRAEPQPYLALFAEVVRRTADLIAQWQAVGFAHGVMNTDNMSILGITLDYGPFGFIDGFNAGFICNHSDHVGRYAFDQQPRVALWNLACLAEAMSPLFDDLDAAREVLAGFHAHYTQVYLSRMAAKLGLEKPDGELEPLLDQLFGLMEERQVDYTCFFRDLGGLKLEDPAHDAVLLAYFRPGGGFGDWLARYRALLRREDSQDERRQRAMDAVNPVYVLRNHLAQQAITQAEAGDYAEVERLRELLARPFEPRPGCEAYAAPAPDWAREIRVSCSS